MSDDPKKTVRPPGPAYHDTKEIPAFKGGTPESALMGEMMRSIELMKQDVLKSVEGVKTEVHHLDRRFEDQTRTNLEAHEATRSHVNALTHMFRVLWTSVKGSDPPPAPPPGTHLAFSMSEQIPRSKASAREIPLDEQISNHDLSLASVSGQIIAIDSVTNQIEKRVQAVEVVSSKLLQLQKEQMGKHEEGISAIRRVTDTISWLLYTPDGRKSLMLFVLFIATVYDKVEKMIRP